MMAWIQWIFLVAFLGVGYKCVERWVRQTIAPCLPFQPPNFSGKKRGSKTIVKWNNVVWRERLVKGAKTCVIFLHGNACDVFDSQWILEWKGNFDLFLPEYPGYSVLDHEIPTEALVCERLSAFMQHRIIHQYDTVYLVGQSLGGYFAAYLAARFPVRGVALVSAFASLDLVVQHMCKLPIGGCVGQEQWNTLAHVKQCIHQPQPTNLIFHGANDTLIPERHAHQLAYYAKSKPPFVFAGADHNHMPYARIIQEMSRAWRLGNKI